MHAPPPIRAPRPRAAFRVAAVAALLTAACLSSTTDGGDSAPAADAPTAGARPGSDATAPMAPVTVELDRTHYAAGGTVNLRLVNRSARTYGYNACTRTLERRDDGAWEAVDESGRICTQELRLLGPQEAQMATTELPEGLQDGAYRLALSLSREDGLAADGTPLPRERAVSAVFRVQ